MEMRLLRHCYVHNTYTHTHTQASAGAKWAVEKIQGSAGKQDWEIKPDVC